MSVVYVAEYEWAGGQEYWPAEDSDTDLVFATAAECFSAFWLRLKFLPFVEIEGVKHFAKTLLEPQLLNGSWRMRIEWQGGMRLGTKANPKPDQWTEVFLKSEIEGQARQILYPVSIKDRKTPIGGAP